MNIDTLLQMYKAPSKLKICSFNYSKMQIRRDKILEMLEYGDLFANVLYETLGISSTLLYKDLKYLVSKGLITREEVKLTKVEHTGAGGRSKILVKLV